LPPPGVAQAASNKNQFRNDLGPIKSAVSQGKDLFKRGGLKKLKLGCTVALGMTDYWHKKGEGLLERISWVQFIAMYNYGNVMYKRVGSSDPETSEFFCDAKYTQIASTWLDIFPRDEVEYIIKTATAIGDNGKLNN
jgi:hypothetical protein